MLKNLLTGAAAVVFAAGLAAASNLTLMSGPQDPSQLLATVNTLIQSINFGVSGRLTAAVTAVGTTTTAESTMQSYTLPANRLANVGDAVRVVCWGTSAASTNAKNAKLYFGASSISTAATAQSTQSPNALKWSLNLLVINAGTATQAIVGGGQVGISPVAVLTSTGSDATTAAVVIKCTGITPTAAQDITAQGMYVEQVK